MKPSDANPPATHRADWLRPLALVGAGVIILTLSAKVQVPFWPVPMTLQVLAVLALSAAYGARLGSLTVLSYLLLGTLGLPLFAGTPEKGIGLAYVTGPTGGYLLGFALAAVATGLAADRLPRWALAPAMLGALALIYLPGLAWLALFVPADKLLALGFTPFILGDLVKLALAAGLLMALPRSWRAALHGGSRDV